MVQVIDLRAKAALLKSCYEYVPALKDKTLKSVYGDALAQQINAWLRGEHKNTAHRHANDVIEKLNERVIRHAETSGEISEARSNSRITAEFFINKNKYDVGLKLGLTWNQIQFETDFWLIGTIRPDRGYLLNKVNSKKLVDQYEGIYLMYYLHPGDGDVKISAIRVRYRVPLSKGRTRLSARENSNIFLVRCKMHMRGENNIHKYDGALIDRGDHCYFYFEEERLLEDRIPDMTTITVKPVGQYDHMHTLEGFVTSVSENYRAYSSPVYIKQIVNNAKKKEYAEVLSCMNDSLGSISINDFKCSEKEAFDAIAKLNVANYLEI